MKDPLQSRYVEYPSWDWTEGLIIINETSTVLEAPFCELWLAMLVSIFALSIAAIVGLHKPLELEGAGNINVIGG